MYNMSNEQELLIREEEVYLKYVIQILNYNINRLKVDLKKIKMKDEEVLEYIYNCNYEQKLQEFNDGKVRRNQKEINEKKVKNYLKALKNPYFGKIIFNKETFYIGYHIADKNNNIISVDWRSPIAELFYNTDTLGVHSYKANNKVIEGHLSLKRQIDVFHGKLIMAFNSNIQIHDYYLKHLIASSASEKMQNIVKSIQKDQNKVIRTDGDLIINGVAGSGKTSVGLHRSAYLMYKEDIKGTETVIIAPNKLFNDYISDVLPSLNVDRIYQTTLENLIKKYAPEINIRTNKNQWLESILSKRIIDSSACNNSNKFGDFEKEKKVIDYKMSNKFLNLIDKYMEIVEENELPIKNYVYNEHFQITKEELKEYLDKNIDKDLSIKEKYYLLVKYIEFLLTIRFPDKVEIENIKKELNGKTFYTRKIYNSLIFNRPFLDNNCNEEEFEIMTYHFIDPVQGILRYEDMIGYLYFKIKYEGVIEQNDIKHLIIDEAQDIHTIEGMLLEKIFKHAKKTILRDIMQKIYHFDFYKFNNFAYTDLNKSFRNTKEITKFASAIIDYEIESLNRSGEEVEYIKAENINRKILEYLLTFKDRYLTVGVLFKTNKDLNYFKAYLSKIDTLHKKYKELCNYVSISGEVKKGINLIPSYDAKGLEFDAVIIPYADGETYTKEDKKLLYVMCTRALNKLVLIYDKSPIEYIT